VEAKMEAEPFRMYILCKAHSFSIMYLGEIYHYFRVLEAPFQVLQLQTEKYEIINILC
jgi:hypothetical protein